MSRIKFCTAVLMAIACIFCSFSYALPDVGEDEPILSPLGMDISNLQAEELYGDMSDDDLFSAHEITILMVWVTWSGASDSCMRLIETQKENLYAQDVNCIGVYYESEQFPVTMGRTYYEERGYTIYSITNRKSPVLDELFDNTDALIPVMYFIDRSGTVRGYASGYLTNYELNRYLLRLRSDSNLVTFIDGSDNSVIYQTIVTDGGFTYYPNTPKHDTYKFRYWDKPCTNITEDTVITAIYDRVGDINYDGVINTGDAVLILKYVAGKVDFSAYTTDIADFNRSGMVNTGDAVAILKMIAA